MGHLCAHGHQQFTCGIHLSLLLPTSSLIRHLYHRFHKSKHAHVTLPHRDASTLPSLVHHTSAGFLAKTSNSEPHFPLILNGKCAQNHTAFLKWCHPFLAITAYPAGLKFSSSAKTRVDFKEPSTLPSCFYFSLLQQETNKPQTPHYSSIYNNKHLPVHKWRQMGRGMSFGFGKV